MTTPVFDDLDSLAQLVAASDTLATLSRDSLLASRLGASLAAQVQSVSAAIRQRFVIPPASESA